MDNEHLKESIDLALITTLASHAFMSKFDEFSGDQLHLYIVGKIPENIKLMIPRDIIKENHIRGLNLGAKCGVFEVTVDGNFKITDFGKTIGAKWIIETWSAITDVTRN